MDPQEEIRRLKSRILGLWVITVSMMGAGLGVYVIANRGGPITPALVVMAWVTLLVAAAFALGFTAVKVAEISLRRQGTPPVGASGTDATPRIRSRRTCGFVLLTAAALAAVNVPLALAFAAGDERSVAATVVWVLVGGAMSLRIIYGFCSSWRRRA